MIFMVVKGFCAGGAQRRQPIMVGRLLFDELCGLRATVGVADKEQVRTSFQTADVEGDPFVSNGIEVPSALRVAVDIEDYHGRHFAVNRHCKFPFGGVGLYFGDLTFDMLEIGCLVSLMDVAIIHIFNG